MDNEMGDRDLNNHINMHFTDSEVNFLVYLGWKTLGWALVFLGVLLVLRFLKIWLLHSWMRETTRGSRLRGRGSDEFNPELERARAEAVQVTMCGYSALLFDYRTAIATATAPFN